MIRKIFLISFIGLLWSVNSGYSTETSGSLEYEIRKEVERFILESIEADSMDVWVQVSSSIDGGIKADDVTDIRVDWRKSSDALAGRVVIPVCVRVRGDAYYTTYATAEIRLFDRVCVTNSLLDRHHIFSQNDVGIEMREITGLHAMPYKDMRNILQRRTTRVIGRGRIITEDMVEDPPLIRQGERIRIILVYGNLKVMTMGFARKDGWLGDRIRVRNPKNRSELVGLVVNSKEVEVRL